ncbi:MAG: aminotransferase class V-fold PLP-dependent enzyme [Clostridia bacterium]|nr:aminotransferase class V-fold PLP-dependent enzyme [Clostridia bacterium]
MKKLVALILAVMMLMSLTAAFAEKTPTIAYVPKVIGQPWWDHVQQGVEQWAADNGIDVIYKGGTTVDAAEQVGIMTDLVNQGIDILCFTGHKGMLGPQGTGGMYVNPKVKVRPLLSGGSGVQTYLKKHPAEMPTALEAGTLNAHGIAGLSAAVDYINETGMENIRKREQALMWNFYNKIKDIAGVTIYGDFSKTERCAIVTVNIWDFDSSQVSDVLYNDYGISTRPGAHCAPLMHNALETEEQGAVRFSFSHFNTDEDVENAVQAIIEIAAEKC